MPINKDLIAKKLEFLNRHLSAIERMEFDEQSFADDEDIHDLIIFRLQQSVETCIDIANHLINSRNLPRKETAKDALLFLGDQKIISKQLSLNMGGAVDFRNRVVHVYNNFDYHVFYKDYKKDVKDLRLFGKEIIKLIETSQKS